MLTQFLAQELGSNNIQVNAITPGVIETRFSQILSQMPQFAEAILNRLPSSRFGTPEDITGLALYLASPASDYVTGSAIGGWQYERGLADGIGTSVHDSRSFSPRTPQPARPATWHLLPFAVQ